MVGMDMVRLLVMWLLPVLLLFAIRKETSRNRAAKDGGDGKAVFELDQVTYWSWLGLFVYLLYAVVIQFGGKFRVSSVWVALVLLVVAVGLMFPFPETITAGPEGLAQEIRFWLKKKKIAWGDVREIERAKGNKLLIVTATDGTKIVHTRQLPDRERLLEELYKYCGEKVPKELRPVMVLAEEALEGAVSGGSGVDVGPAVDDDRVAGSGPAVDV